MSNIKAPCLNCKDRHPLCHSSCIHYLSYKQEHDKIKEQIRKDIVADQDYYSMKEAKFKRLKNKRR